MFSLIFKALIKFFLLDAFEIQILYIQTKLSKTESKRGEKAPNSNRLNNQGRVT